MGAATPKKKRMTVGYARAVLNTIYGGVLPPGTLWVSGYLDEASEAKRVLKRAATRAAKRAASKQSARRTK